MYDVSSPPPPPPIFDFTLCIQLNSIITSSPSGDRASLPVGSAGPFKDFSHFMVGQGVGGAARRPVRESHVGAEGQEQVHDLHVLLPDGLKRCSQKWSGSEWILRFMFRTLEAGQVWNSASLTFG